MPARKGNDGVWRYQKMVRMPGGGKHRISGTPTRNTKLEAERAEREHIARTLIPAKEGPKPITLKEFIEAHWLPVYPTSVGNRASTIREKKLHCEYRIVPWLGKYLLTDIKGMVVDTFFAKLAADTEGTEKLSKKSIRNYHATLRKVFAKAVDWGYLDKIPTLPTVKAPDPEWDFYVKAESDLLLSAPICAADPETKALLMFAVQTGARQSEQLAIEWGDIDFANNLVIFRRADVRKVVDSTKSGKDRKVPMTGELRRLLLAIKHNRSARVFCDSNGEEFSPNHLYARQRKAMTQAGLRAIRWHDLRHTFGSQLMIAGTPIKQIQTWMGHSNILMTMRYAHLAPGKGEEHIAALESVSSGPSGIHAKPVQNAQARSEKPKGLN